MGSSPLDEFDWGNDPETAMLVQFDRLPSELQVILRIACVIGQVFFLSSSFFLFQNHLSSLLNLF